MTTEIRNWAVVAEAMEAQGATNSQMYIRAKALPRDCRTLCRQAFRLHLTQFRKFVKHSTDLSGLTLVGPLSITMANHRLSLEQKFHLEAAFREIDACEDIDVLRALTKQIIASTGERKGIRSRSSRADSKGDGSRSLEIMEPIGDKRQQILGWLDRISSQRGLEWWTL